MYTEQNVPGSEPNIHDRGKFFQAHTEIYIIMTCAHLSIVVENICKKNLELYKWFLFHYKEALATYMIILLNCASSTAIFWSDIISLLDIIEFMTKAEVWCKYKHGPQLAPGQDFCHA